MEFSTQLLEPFSEVADRAFKVKDMDLAINISSFLLWGPG
jgi:hypothetical protein